MAQHSRFLEGLCEGKKLAREDRELGGRPLVITAGSVDASRRRAIDRRRIALIEDVSPWLSGLLTTDEKTQAPL